MKICDKCKMDKEIICFSKNKNRKDGLNAICKVCAKAWRDAHRFDGRIVAAKTCYSCNVSKSVEYFYKDRSRIDGLSNQCKQCVAVYRTRNRDKILASQKIANKKASERQKISVTGRVCSQCHQYKTSESFWKSKHTKDGLYPCCIDCKKFLDSTKSRKENKRKCIKEWTARHYDTLKKERNKWDKEKRRSDLSYRLRRNVMHAIVASVRNYTFSGKLERLKDAIFNHLDYNAEDLRHYIESRWEPWMTWNNYGKYQRGRLTWQIDHIIPQSTLPFNSFDEDNFKKLWALDNLRPLETVANIRKGNRVQSR